MGPSLVSTTRIDHRFESKIVLGPPLGDDEPIKGPNGASP